MEDSYTQRLLKESVHDPVLADVLLRTLCTLARQCREEGAFGAHPQKGIFFNQGLLVLQQQYPQAARKLEKLMQELRYPLRDAEVMLRKARQPRAFSLPIPPVESPPPPTQRNWWQRLCHVG